MSNARLLFLTSGDFNHCLFFTESNLTKHFLPVRDEFKLVRRVLVVLLLSLRLLLRLQLLTLYRISTWSCLVVDSSK